jgi:hypothetical protein
MYQKTFVETYNPMFAVQPTADGRVLASGEAGGQGYIRWYAADGSYNSAIMNLPCAPLALALADLDGDGNLDPLAASDCADYGVFWLQNTGSDPNNDWPRRSLSEQAGVDVAAMQLADLDDDSDLDVAAAGAPGFVWWENDGTPLDGAGSHTPSRPASRWRLPWLPATWTAIATLTWPVKASPAR